MTVHVSRDSKSALVCPETQVFQCHKTITEESETSFAQQIGINVTFGPCGGVSRVSNFEELVVCVHLL